METPRSHGSLDDIDAMAASMSEENTPPEVMRLTNTVRFLGERLKVRDQEFKTLIDRLNRAGTTTRKRRTLREQGNAVAADLVALQSVYRDQMANLVSVKARSSVALCHPSQHKTLIPKASRDSGVSMSFSSCDGDSPRRCPSVRTSPTPTQSPTSPSFPMPQSSSLNPSRSRSVRRLSGLSTAFSLYAHYFYPWLQPRAALLVDAEAMEARWRAKPVTRAARRRSVASYDGFIADGSPCAEPMLWLLATVVAALNAVLSPRQSQQAEDGGEGEGEAEEGETAEATSSRSSALPLIAEVFDGAAQVQWMKNGNPFSKKCFSARLRADLGFWEAFAQQRGLVDAAEAKTEDKEPAIHPGQDFTEDGRREVLDLLVWLLGARESPVGRGLRHDVTVKSPVAIRITERLAALGLQLAWQTQSSSEDGKEGSTEGPRVISVRREESCNTPSPVVREPTAINTTSWVEPIDMILSAVQEEEEDSGGPKDGESESEESSGTDADTVATTISEGSVSFVVEKAPPDDQPAEMDASLESWVKRVVIV